MTTVPAPLERLAADLHYALRRLAASPGFSFAAILTLGLGIGANVAIFTLTYQVHLRPLPYRDPAQLVAVWGDASYRGIPKSNVSPPDFLDWRRDATVFIDMAAYLTDLGATAIGAGGRPERIDIRMVSGNFFSLLGVPPAVGRVLRNADDMPGAAPVAVISHAFWQRRFGGRADIAGTTLESGATRFQVVGVMPPEFQYGAANTDVWMPLRPALSPRDWENRTNYLLDAVARLKPGVTVSEAHAELDGIARRLAAVHLPANERRGARVLPLREEFVGASAGRAYVLVFGAAGCVLLVACLNVAQLLLVRGLRRHRDFAVRASLGASRTRLVLQLLAETAVLTVLASAVGLVVYEWTAAYFTSFVPTRMAGVTDLRVNGAVLLFTAIAGAATACAAGLMPALRASSVHLMPPLHTAGSAGRRGSRLRSLLVVSEVGVAVLLLVCSALFVATMSRLYDVDPGFNPSNLLTANLPFRGDADIEATVERISALPGVVSAGVGTVRPLEAFPGRFPWTIEGEPRDTSAQPRALLRTADATFLATLEVPLLRGRMLDGSDRRGSPPVVLINESMRRRYWGDRDPIGARITRNEAGAWYTVVGIVGDVRQRALDVEAEPEVIVPYLQYDGPAFYRPRTLVVRTESNAASLIDAVRREIGAIDSAAALPDVVTMDRVVRAGVDDRQRMTVLLSGSSALTLLLAILGVYAIVSSTVTDRTQEIGVRIALGAGPASVVRMVIREGLALAAIGCAAGLLAALGLTRLLETFLFGVTASDPASFGIAAVLVLSIAAAASYVPARRTTRINLRTALYYE